jgi:Leucine-rich repeat (LRR) protein
MGHCEMNPLLPVKSRNVIVRAVMIALGLCTSIALGCLLVYRANPQSPIDRLERLPGVRLTKDESGQIVSFSTLWIYRTPITDRDLECLRGQPIKRLTLCQDKITDDGLKALRSMDGLEVLCLLGLPISDAGLQSISMLTNLNKLTIAACESITDKATKSLAGLIRLRALNLSNTQVSGSGLGDLTRLTDLEELDMTHTPLDDHGAIYIGGMRNLKKLRLSETRITDNGLKHLEGLTKLKELEILGTPVTHEGLVRLKSALPLVRVAF